MQSFSLHPDVSVKDMITTSLLRIFEYFKFPSLPSLRTRPPENAATAYLLHIIEKGQVVFHIGRQEASTLYFLSQKVGVQGNVVAFEEHEATYKYLREAKQLLNWNNVTIENIPLSGRDKPQPVTLSKKEKQSPGATVIRFDVFSKKRDASTDESPSLSRYCTIHQVYPSIIALDAQGDEFSVIVGAVELLKSHKPAILVTCEERKAGREKIESLFRLLTALRYKGYFMLDTMLLPIDNFDFDVYQNPNTNFNCSTFLFR